MDRKRIILTRPAVPVRGAVVTPTTSTTTTVLRTRERMRSVGDTDVVGSCPRSRAYAQPGTHASQAEDFVNRIKSLPEGERKKILDSLLLESQLNGEAKATRDLDMWAEAVHRELTRRLGSLDGGLVGPGVVRKLVSAGGSWKPVEQFMATSKLSELTVVERQRAYYMLAELLVRHALVVARRSGAPMSAKLVSNCTGNLAGVFEESFPGYLEAGLARMVARHAERI